MNASNRDELPAVAARQRGRARLRSATIAVGAAGLVATGVVAYTLPGGVTHATSGTSAAGTSTATTTGSAGTGSASAPAASSGASHATSGGS